MLKGILAFKRVFKISKKNQLYEWNDRARDARVNEAVIYQLTHYRMLQFLHIILAF